MSKMYCVQDVKTGFYVDKFSIIFPNEIVLKALKDSSQITIPKNQIIKVDKIECFCIYPAKHIHKILNFLQEKTKKFNIKRDFKIVDAPTLIDLSRGKRITIKI